MRLNFEHFMPRIAQLAACICLATPSLAQTETVLELCLDTSVTPETRVEKLLENGWKPTKNEENALATALTLTRMSAGKPETWSEVQEESTKDASMALGESNVKFFENPSNTSAVFIGRDRSGLQTCLYLDENPDLSALEKALDGSIIRTIGEVSRIRGDGVKSLISAHAISEKGRHRFAPPLPYALTFTVVLDRQPSDVN